MDYQVYLACGFIFTLLVGGAVALACAMRHEDDQHAVDPRGKWYEHENMWNMSEMQGHNGRAR